MRVAIAILAFAALLGGSALAQQVQTTVDPNTKNTTQTGTQSGLGFSKHDTKQPINVASDAFQGDTANKIGIYTGNVVVVQGDMKMRSDSMKIVEVEDKPNKIYAYTNVVVNAPNGTATGDDGVYDMVAHTITLTGKVVLTKEKNVMRGTKLVMDMDTNLAHLTAQGMPGGRVQAILYPKEDTANAPAKKPAPNGGK
jgi:lipopolysaccharide export system protein LptA